MLRGKLLSLLTGVAVVIGLLAAPVAPAQAASGSNFDAADIMSDSLFYDGSAMTSAQIQSFLDSKIGTCSSSDCINILRTNVSSRAARISDTTGNLVCNAFTGGTNLLVSEIIYRSQVACGISAKVILVTLQKEQGLVTSKNPSDWNLSFAMGQACPDTAPCDPAFQGVGVQILAGTTQLKTYKAANFARQPGTHSIKYNPSSSCGTKTITIRNYATAALYNYTPYTPNAAALSNLYGSGNSCSSYGNRNFWRDFTDWFGSTHSTSVTNIDTIGHLLTLTSAGKLYAYPTSGKGGWQPPVSLGEGFTNVTRAVAPGDLDGDGHRDLLTVASNGKVSLHRGTGSLEYADPVPLAADWSGAKLITAAGDFSGDGNPDVFTTNAAGDLLLWRGTASGALGTPVKVGNGWGAVNMIVGGADFSGDGRLDLIGRHSNGNLIMYEGSGRGWWSGSKKIGNGWGEMSGIYMPGDFTGDGRTDLIAKDTAGGMWLYPGAGAGRFGNKSKVGVGWQSFTAILDAGARAAGARVPPAGAGDVDSDAHRDVVAVTSTGALRLYRGNGRGVLPFMVAMKAKVPVGARMLQMGDFNDDAVSDIGYIDASGRFWLLPGNGRGDYGAAVQIGNGWSIYSLVFGGIDFDGDGRMDVIARDAAGTLFMYRGNGAGSWASGAIQIGLNWNSMTAVLSVGDFDGDRKTDIIARRSDGALFLYPGNGAGDLLGAQQIGHGWNGMNAIFSPGDFDESGGPELIARHADGTLWVYRSTGKGGWLKPVSIGQGWNGMAWIG